MVERIFASKALGLELDTMRLKAALVSRNRNKNQIDQLYTFHFPEPHSHAEHQVNPLILAEDGKAFLDLTAANLVVSAVNANETLIRPLEIKLKKDKDIDAVLLFQAEPLLPYPTENAVVDRINLARTADGTQMTVLGVRKDHLQHHLIQWQPLEIEPEIVVSTPAALAAFSNFVLPDSPLHFILHIGEKQTCCVFVKDGKLISAQSSAYDLYHLKQTLSKDLEIEIPTSIDEAFKNQNWQTTANDEHTLTAAALRNFHMEVNRMVYALVRQEKLLEVPPILVTGDITDNPELYSFLIGNFQKAINVPTIAEDSNFDWEKLQCHAISLGSALMALPSYPDQVNFRQDDFSYPNPWKRFLKPVGIYAALMCALAASLYFFGHAFLKSSEDNVRRAYAELLVASNLPYQEVETELLNRGKKNPVSTPLDILPIEALTLAEIQSRLDFISKKIQSTPDNFPLQPNVPRVSDLMAWLATHSKIVGEASPKNKLPLIEIENVNYTMVKKPDVTKKLEKYQVKVELEFKAANATAAREFHDALLAPNPFVDPKAEVKWTSQKGNYKAAFNLKDTTVYP